MKLTSFQIEVTGLVGAPLCGGLLPISNGIRDPQWARGIILEENKIRTVFCAVDYCEIGGRFYREWKKLIARAAKTNEDHVMLHSVHQHQAPFLRDDDYAEKIDSRRPFAYGFTFKERGWWKRVSRLMKKGIRDSLSRFEAVDKIGLGKTIIQKMASNRRILDKKGKVRATRWSICRDKKLQQEPEGLIDPELQSVTFWDRKQKLLGALSFYATHPQSSIGLQMYSSEMVGEMHLILQKKYPGTPFVYFSGCQGQITLGKYSTLNTEKNYRIFGSRLAQGILKSIKSSSLQKEQASDIRVKSLLIDFPYKLLGSLKNWKKKVIDPKVDSFERYSLLAMRGAQINRKQLIQQRIFLYKIGSAQILSLPGEPFIEYQLYGKKVAGKQFVAFAGLGDCTPGYIPTKKAYQEGGYEVCCAAAFCSSNIEVKMKNVIRELLKTKND